MAKVDTDAQAQAVQTLLGGLSLKRKQEIVERNDRLRFQFLQTQKMPAGKAREPQLNAFLSGVITDDRKMREVVFSAWTKDNTQPLGEVPALPERYKFGSELGDDDGDAEGDLKEATAAVKKWLKVVDFDLVNAYARLGPFELPAKVLAVIKKPKSKDAPEGEPGEASSEAPAAVASVASEAALAELRAELEREREKLEAKLARQDEEVNKFKRLLEENKEKRKSELNETTDKARAELATKQAEWQRVEANLRKEIQDLNRQRLDAADKTSKVRDELLPLRQQIERAEKEAKRFEGRAQAAAEETRKAEEATRAGSEELDKLRDRLKLLESAQQQLVSKEKALQRFQERGASVSLASTDNLKIWEEALNEQEVKEAFKRTFNLDTIGVSTYENDERDLAQVWKELITQEADIVNRFFALPFDELQTPSEDFRELVTNFIELKDSLVAREQLAHLLNFVGNRFLQSLKQKV